MPPSSRIRRSRRRGTDRVTPYSTSQRRQRGSSPDFLPNHSLTSYQTQVVESLLSKSWRLYRVSPLWQFETSSTKLHSYRSQLNNHLLATPSLEGGYSSDLTPLPRFGLDGATALQIDIHRKENSQHNSSEAVLILCRVKPSQLSPGEGFVSLPLLLSQGPLKLVEPVVRWMGAMFDCFVSPFSLTQEDLFMLASHYANSEPEGNQQGNIELVYSTPDAVKKAGLSNIAIELPRQSVETVWNVASRKVKGDGSEGKVKKLFLEMIGDVVSRGTSIRLESYTLTRISTPVLQADGAGLLKFLSSSAPIPVLAVLQSSWSNN